LKSADYKGPALPRTCDTWDESSFTNKHGAFLNIGLPEFSQFSLPTNSIHAHATTRLSHG
jgi:hypothetical protein